MSKLRESWLSLSRPAGAFICLVALACGPTAEEPEAFAASVSAAGFARDDRPRCPIRAWSDYRLRGKLAAGERASLAVHIQELQEGYEAVVNCDREVVGAFAASTPADRATALALDEWVADQPQSWIAATARGFFYWTLAADRRGSEVISKTSAQQLAGMHEAVSRGKSELQRALRLEPDAVAPHAALLAMARMASDPDFDSLYDRAVERHPLSFQVHVRKMHALAPRWGGSLRAGQSFAASLSGAARRNPELRTLAAYPVRERGLVLWQSDDPEGALRFYDRAFAIGTRPTWLVQAARIAYAQGLYERARIYLEMHEERWGRSADQLHWLSKVQAKRGQLDEALRTTQALLELDPGDARASQSMARYSAH